MKKNIKLYLLSAIIGFLIPFFVRYVSDIMVDRSIAKKQAQIEAELKAQGLLPQEPVRRRPKKEIYIPIDRTGQEGRVDSTEMFRKSAERTFGQKGDDGLSTIDYGSQVDEYQQRVEAIRREEARRLAEQRAQQEALNQKMGRAGQPQRPVKSSVSGADNKDEGTKINRLKTSSLKSQSKKY